MISRRVFGGAAVLACAYVALAGALVSASEAGGDQEGQEIINKYLAARQTQKEALLGAQMRVNIDAKLPRLEKQGTLTALRRISRLGKITYKALGFSGDNTIKNEVITRYLAAEAEAPENAIVPANYKFKYKGAASPGKYARFVRPAAPRPCI